MLELNSKYLVYTYLHDRRWSFRTPDDKLATQQIANIRALATVASMKSSFGECHHSSGRHFAADGSARRAFFVCVLHVVSLPLHIQASDKASLKKVPGSGQSTQSGAKDPSLKGFLQDHKTIHPFPREDMQMKVSKILVVVIASVYVLGFVEGQNNDLFNYGSSDRNENGITSRGQPNWDQVRCGNDEICVSKV